MSKSKIINITLLLIVASAFIYRFYIYEPPPPTTPNIEENPKMVDYDFVILEPDSTKHNFSEWKNKTVFLNVWASWCKPCRMELEEIYALHSKLKDSISFVLISVDDKKNDAIDYFKNKGYDMPIYFLEDDIGDPFSTRSFPRCYVISKEGKVLVKADEVVLLNEPKFIDFLINL